MAGFVLGVRLSFVGFGVDGNVIHINGQPTLGNFFSEDSVHHHLECCWGVCQAKEHDCWFEEAFMRKESRLPFISWFDSHIIVAPSDVKFSEECALCQSVNRLWNEGHGVAVLS